MSTSFPFHSVFLLSILTPACFGFRLGQNKFYEHDKFAGQTDKPDIREELHEYYGSVIYLQQGFLEVVKSANLFVLILQRREKVKVFSCFRSSKARI